MLRHDETLPLSNRPLLSRRRKSPADSRSAILITDKCHGGLADRHDDNLILMTRRKGPPSASSSEVWQFHQLVLSAPKVSQVFHV